MTKCYIVAEGPCDASLLSVLLADIIQGGDAKVVDARGRSSAVSLARTFLATRPASVALVADADATAPERVKELEAELEDSLAAVSARERFAVCLAVPSLEACLFEDEEGLREQFGEGLSAGLTAQSRYEPKAVVSDLLRTRKERYTPDTLVALLKRLNLDRLRGAPVVKKLSEFVTASLSASPDAG